MPLLKREAGRSRVLADGTGAESDPAVSEVPEVPQVSEEPTVVSEVSEGPQFPEEEPAAAVNEVSEGPQVAEEPTVVSEVSDGPQFPEELRELAERNAGGWVYDVDAKMRDDGVVPPRHVLGAWRIDADGSPSGEYVANPYFGPFNKPRRRFRRGWMAAAAVVVLLVIAGAAVIIIRHSTKRTTPSSGLVTPHRSTGTNHKPTSSVTGAQPVQLEIAAKSRVWVCLQDARGHVLVNGHVLQPGQVVHRVQSPVFHVYLGNSGVALRVNGKAQALAASSSPIGYTITQHQLSRLPAGAKPPCP